MYVINYDITRMVTEFNEEYQDWSGSVSDFGTFSTGVFRISEEDWSAERLLKEIRDIMEEFVWDNVDYVSVWEDNRFSFCCTENGEGTPDIDGKYLADYNMYLEIASTHGEIKELDFISGNGVELQY